jgi:DNA mismatch repair protein MutS
MALSKTPVMQQHAEAKAVHPDAILFFRLGDFYEMFGDDAVLGAQLLDLTLTSRNKGKPDEVPMAGVPYHAAPGYIARLLAVGRKVAICEQMADPKTVKGIVPRAVVRVITPGTAIHDDQLLVRQNNWLAAAEIGERGTGLAFFDLSTGELALGDVASVGAALAELALVRPREILLGGVIPEEQWAEIERSVRQTLPDALVTRDQALAPTELAQLLPEGDEALLEFLNQFVIGRGAPAVTLQPVSRKPARHHVKVREHVEESDANLAGADLHGAKYNRYTQWPAGFEWETAGLILVQA